MMAVFEGVLIGIRILPVLYVTMGRRLIIRLRVALVKNVLWLTVFLAILDQEFNDAYSAIKSSLLCIMEKIKNAFQK